MEHVRIQSRLAASGDPLESLEACAEARALLKVCEVSMGRTFLLVVGGQDRPDV